MPGMKYWRLEKLSCLVLGALLGVLSTLSTPIAASANDSVSAMMIPSFMALELEKPASLLDRALLGAYQLRVRDPEGINSVLQENVKQKLNLSDEQLQAVRAFFPAGKSRELNWTQEKLDLARTALAFKFSDLRRILDPDLAIETAFQMHRIVGAGDVQLSFYIRRLPDLAGPVTLDALAKLNAMTKGMDVNLKASERLVRELLITSETYPKNSRNIISSAIKYLEPQSRGYFLISVLKAAILRSHVEEGTYELRADRLKVIGVAVELLKPMVLDNKIAGVLLNVLHGLRQTLDIDYFQIFEPFFTELKALAGPDGLPGLLQLTSGSLENFRMAGNFDDARILFGAREMIESYLKRYELDMSLRTPEQRSQQASEDLKTILRRPGLENYEIAFQEPLLLEILNHVNSQHLQSVLNTFLLRRAAGEVVSPAFVRAFAKKFDQVPNVQIEGVIAAIMSNSTAPASLQQVNLLIELKKTRREKLEALDVALARKVGRKILLGVFIASGAIYDDFTAPHMEEMRQLLESYREVVSRDEYLKFVGDLVEQINKENVRRVNLDDSLLYSLLKRYQQAGARTNGAADPSAEVCSRLLYNELTDVRARGEAVDADVIPFRPAR